ncbi:MAG TPA: hypothetical protein VKA73_10500 [Rubrobacter sp.]|nr:hypothetical protein [Rubrobacter sp.]
MEEYRPGVEQALTLMAIHDTDFVRSVRDDPESALWRYGFALNPAEMGFVREYLARYANLNDREIVEKLQEPQPMGR